MHDFSKVVPCEHGKLAKTAVIPDRIKWAIGSIAKNKCSGIDGLLITSICRIVIGSASRLLTTHTAPIKGTFIPNPGKTDYAIHVDSQYIYTVDILTSYLLKGLGKLINT